MKDIMNLRKVREESTAARKRGRLIDVYRQLRNEYGFGRFAALIGLLDWL